MFNVMSRDNCDSILLLPRRIFERCIRLPDSSFVLISFPFFSFNKLNC